MQLVAEGSQMLFKGKHHFLLFSSVTVAQLFSQCSVWSSVVLPNSSLYHRFISIFNHIILLKNAFICNNFKSVSCVVHYFLKKLIFQKAFA